MKYSMVRSPTVARSAHIEWVDRRGACPLGLDQICNCICVLMYLYLLVPSHWTEEKATAQLTWDASKIDSWTTRTKHGVGGWKMITVRTKQSGTKRGWQLKRSGPDTFRQRLGSYFDRGATSHIFTFFRHATLSTDLQFGWLELFYFWAILSNSMVRHVGCRQQFAWSQWAWVGSVGWVGGWRFQLAIARFLNLYLDWQHLFSSPEELN